MARRASSRTCGRGWSASSGGSGAGLAGPIDSAASIGIVYEVNENDTEHLNGVLDALKQFVSTLESDDDFFFVAFNKRGSVTTGFVPSPAEACRWRSIPW